MRALALGFVLVSSAHAESKTFSDVEKIFSEFRSENPWLTLVEGNDFCARAGTVIFVSREEGIRRLVALARSGYPEIAVLYAPTLGAWITMTVESYPKQASLQSEYFLVVLQSEGVAEWWHNHNMRKEDATEWDTFDDNMRWVMPSYIDLRQTYAFAHAVPEARTTGHIAHPFGTTDFWVSKLRRRKPHKMRERIDAEAIALKEGVVDIPFGSPAQDIPAFASRHKRVFRIRYKPMP